MISTTYAEFECRDCGYIHWSENEKEIRELKELYDTGHLECPYCGNHNFNFRIKGKGGGNNSFFDVASSATPHPL
ncbi:MAG TPA: hypothetical protein ENI53_01515 [Thermoplasmatales archaeon]|nr:hypothetical protein [Thermoplasmatales archaeon]